VAWDQHLIAEPEGPSFIFRTVTHRRLDRRCLVSHDPRAKSPVPTFGEIGRTTLCYRPKRCGASNVRSRHRGRAPHAQTDGRLPRSFGRRLLSCGRYLPHGKEIRTAANRLMALRRRPAPGTSWWSVDGLPSRKYWPSPIDPALSGSPPMNPGDKICDRIAATHLPVRYCIF
jgi:hypothetical protein